MNPSQKNNNRQNNIGTGQTNNPGGAQPNPGANPELPEINTSRTQPGKQPVDGIMPPQGTQANTPGSTAQPQNPRPQQPPQVQPAVSSAPAGKQPRAKSAKSNPNSTQNNLQIAEIRDGIVIMNDGSFRSVVMTKSINFDLMSPAEREGVELGFQNFLNSLYFPIQIFIRSQKVDLGPYIEKLDKIRTEHDNMLLALLMEDYVNYIDQLASQTNIMDKHFYVVVPFFPKDGAQNRVSTNKGLLGGVMNIFSGDQTHLVINEADLAAAKTELKNRVQAVLGGLMECSVQGLPLDTQELIELYYDSYNPDTATRQQLKDFTGMNTPVVTKGEGDARQPNLEKELG
jgi:hypothetical protein